MRAIFALFIAALVGLVAQCAFAHEMRPAYLELHQTGTASYSVL